LLSCYYRVREWTDCLIQGILALTRYVHSPIVCRNRTRSLTSGREADLTGVKRLREVYMLNVAHYSCYRFSKTLVLYLRKPPQPNSTGRFLGLLFEPEDGNDMHFRSNSMEIQPRSLLCSYRHMN
jgi:hypothetical protein